MDFSWGDAGKFQRPVQPCFGPCQLMSPAVVHCRAQQGRQQIKLPQSFGNQRHQLQPPSFSRRALPCKSSPLPFPFSAVDLWLSPPIILSVRLMLPSSSRSCRSSIAGFIEALELEKQIKSSGSEPCRVHIRITAHPVHGLVCQGVVSSQPMQQFKVAT